jgi:hypothetical protein
MRDLIVGCADNYSWDQLKCWVNSINQSGFEGKKVIILFNCDALSSLKVIESGFDVIGFGQDDDGNLIHKSQMPVHVERFFHIFNLLNKEEFRYVITTDVKDVVFQKNPIDYIINHDRDLIFSSENIRYQHEPWGDQNLMQTFGKFWYELYKDNEIFNVGVLAGKAEAMKYLCRDIFQYSLNRPIPIVDQAVFNFIISQYSYNKMSLYTRDIDGWACNLGTTMDPNKVEQFRHHWLVDIPKIVGDKVVSPSFEEYHIVHQYDRVPELKNIIEEKYK